jgi:CheY-like chemotaxis protein
MELVILIADDEPDFLANCERLLQPLGFVCRTAKTGPEAIELLDQVRPDLVVADLRLPGADGLAVARRARALVPPVPVVLITAYDSAWAKDAAREAGAATYLPKPFTNAEFLNALRHCVDAQSSTVAGSHDRPVCLSCAKPVRLGVAIAVQDGIAHIRCLSQEAQLASMGLRLRARDQIRAAEAMRQRAVDLLRRGDASVEERESHRVPRNQADAIGNLVCPGCGHPVTSDNGVPVREYLIHSECHPSPSTPANI